MWIQFVPPDGLLVFREDYPILSGEQQGANHTSVRKRSKGLFDTFHLRFPAIQTLYSLGLEQYWGCRHLLCLCSQDVTSSRPCPIVFQRPSSLDD